MARKKKSVKHFLLDDEMLEKLAESGPLGPALLLLYNTAKEHIEEVETDQDEDRQESLKAIISYTVATVILIQQAPLIAGAGVMHGRGDEVHEVASFNDLMNGDEELSTEALEEFLSDDDDDDDD